MMIGCSERIITRSPFTPSQWEELEQQALVFKYMASGSPIPQDLIYTVQRSLESSLSSDLLHQLGWGNGYRLAGGYGLRKIDPEPGRCRRTDGKKWRCSKEAYPDSKYCERHMHRGRNRSRKPVEFQSPSSPPSAAAAQKPGNIFPAVTRNPLSSGPLETRFVHLPHFSSAQESSNTRFFLESHGFTLSTNKAYRKQVGDGIKGATDNERAFLSMKAEAYYPSGLENERQKTHELHYYNNRDINLLGINVGRESDHPKKVMHHFLDESPPEEEKSFSNCPINESELNLSVDNTQPPMTAVPNSLHDFFMTQKW